MKILVTATHWERLLALCPHLIFPASPFTSSSSRHGDGALFSVSNNHCTLLGFVAEPSQNFAHTPHNLWTVQNPRPIFIDELSYHEIVLRLGNSL